MSWLTPRTWVAGEKPTAATMNAHIRDQFAALGDAWTTTTGSWTSSGTAPALGNGSCNVRWRQIGKTVDVEIRLTLGSTSTVGTGSYTLGALPAAALDRTLLRGFFFDTSASAYYNIYGSVSAGGTTITLRRAPTTAGDILPVLTSALPVVPANGDVIVIKDFYEAA